MQFDIVNGWLTQARREESVNCDERPGADAVALLVIHGISLPPGEFGGPWIDHLFTNALDAGAHPFFKEIEGMKVSAHVLIRRDGEVVQYVPFSKRAWHAGESCFAGRQRCNDFSIGIELEGCDDLPYEEEQYKALALVTRAIMKAYPEITPDRIAGHSDIAPGRKTDPGPFFNWQKYHSLLRGI